MNETAGSAASSGVFAPETVRSGAVLPDDTALFAAIDAILEGTAALTPGTDTWLADGVPALSRGRGWVLPYSWRGAAATVDAADRHDPDLDAGSDRWATRIDSWLEYCFRAPIVILPREPDPVRYADLPVRYADELARTGMRSAGVWGGNDTVSVVHVVYGDPGPGPVLARAIHVVPKHWVWYDRPRKHTRWPVTEMPPTDLSWSWADVVALDAPARQRAP